jgi:CheY-like chemotaxis protein
VTTAINGHEAYEIIDQSLKDKDRLEDSNCLFDIVFLDLNMPISNGYEACTKILKLFNKDQIFRVESSNNLSL